MKKFTNPNLTGEVYITQNYHGENEKNPNDLSVQIAIDIKGNEGAPRYSICDGLVEKITDGLNGYVSIIPDGLQVRVLHVHTKNFTVAEGQRVKAGDLIGYVRKPVSGGTHKHIGMKNLNGKAPQPQIMDYFDRSIVFRTEYQDIADDWFNGKIGGDINWGLFHDYYYGNDTNNTPTTFKVGDKIIFTQKQNKRGGAGDKFDDIGAYTQGDIAVIKDGPRTSQNSQFGKGDNDSFTWFDTQPANGSQSCWVADMGFFRLWKESDPPVVPPVEPPEDPEITKLKDEIDRLNTEQLELQGQIEGLKSTISRMDTELKKAKASLLDSNKTIEADSITINRITEELTTSKNNEKEAIRKMTLAQENAINEVGRQIGNWFKELLEKLPLKK